MKKPPRLTTKQKLFVQAIVSGLSQREAYMKCYSTRTKNMGTVDRDATRQMAKEHVRAYYDELMGEVAKAVCWDRERAARELLEARELALEHIKRTKDLKVHMDDHGKRELPDLPKSAVDLVIKSTAELNKMFGIYEKADGRDGAPVIVDDIPRPEPEPAE